MDCFGGKEVKHSISPLFQQSQTLQISNQSECPHKLSNFNVLSGYMQSAINLCPGWLTFRFRERTK